MEYQITCDRLTITLVSLSQRHLWRVSGSPSRLTKPEPPEGYTHQAALDNLPDYKKQVDAYEVNLQYETAYRSIGAARRLALNTPGLDLKAEGEQLVRLADLYCVPFPDVLATDQAVGDALFEVFHELMGPDVYTEFMSAGYWLSAMAGGVTPEAVSEAIKSFRRDNRRRAAGGSLPEGSTGAQSGAAPADHSDERVVRPGKRRKAVGRAAAPVA